MKIEAGSTELAKLQKQGKSVRVLLDGVDISHVCVMADDEKGMVRRAVLTPDGRFQSDPAHPDIIWCEDVYGTVRIEIKDDIENER